jgi:putative FmdB family regulatory protein
VPKYCYYCESCKMGFEIVHSMKEKKEQCEACGAYALRRLPSIPNYIKKINKDPNKKVGTVVEEYIRKNKESISEEKKKLREKEYKK